jgi:hypothetical protein
MTLIKMWLTYLGLISGCGSNTKIVWDYFSIIEFSLTKINHSS